MRTLSSTVLAAQQGLSVTPAVSCVRTRASAWEKRYVIGAPISITGGVASEPAALCAGNGVANLFRLHGGAVLQTPISGTPPAAGSTVTRWTTGDGLIAAAQQGSQIAVVTAPVNGTSFTVHMAPGGVFGAAESVTPALTGGDVIQSLACCFSPDGARLFVVLGGTDRVYVTVRTAANTYSAAVSNSDLYENFISIAAAYTKATATGDVAVLVAASWNSGYSELALQLFGDGDQVTAGAWATHKDLLSVQSSGSGTLYGTILTAGGLALADTLRASFLEAFTNPAASITWQCNWTCSYLSPQYAALGYARDPQPLPQAETTPLCCAYDPLTDRLFYATGATVYPTLAPATQDLSSRVLLCDRHDAENQGTANVLLDNADGALTGLAFDPEASGDRLALDFGYVTSAGTEVSAGAPVWVAAVELTAGTGTGYVELICHDAWSLLAAWQPRRLYLWPAGSNTILQIIQWLLARNGIPLVSPPSPSAQLLRTPAYAIQPATSGAHALHALLDQVPETLHFTAQGAVLRTPLAGETPVYAYTPSAHPVLSYRVHTGAQSLNDVLVFGRSQPTSTAPTLLAEAIDAPDGLRVAGHPFPVTDMQVSVAEAANRAAITLRKAQYIQDAGEIATVPNVGLELWDLVALTVGDPGGWINAPARVRALHTRYDRLTDGGVYTQSVGLMYP